MLWSVATSKKVRETRSYMAEKLKAAPRAPRAPLPGAWRASGLLPSSASVRWPAPSKYSLTPGVFWFCGSASSAPGVWSNFKVCWVFPGRLWPSSYRSSRSSGCSGRNAIPPGPHVSSIVLPIWGGNSTLSCWLLKFGDTWLRGESPPPLQLFHKECGHNCSPLVVCSHCITRILLHRVSHPRDGPGAGSSPREADRIRSRRVSHPAALERGRPCSVARTLLIRGDRWTFLVLRETFFGIRRV